MRARPGTIYLVGAGPGDPDLITVRGRGILASADAVVHDRLISPELLTLARPDALIENVGKAPGRAPRSQADIERLLIRLARAGRAVCRLKGGDPFVFGRGGEEVLAARAAGVPVAVVPGVTSAIAAPAAAQVPVTHRGLAASFTVVSGHAAPGGGVDWRRIAQTPGTLVVLMGAANLEAVARALIDGGRAPGAPARSIERATLPGQRIVTGTLATIAAAARAAGLSNPAVTVIGPAAAVLADGDLLQHDEPRAAPAPPPVPRSRPAPP